MSWGHGRTQVEGQVVLAVQEGVGPRAGGVS